MKRGRESNETVPLELFNEGCRIVCLALRSSSPREKVVAGGWWLVAESKWRRISELEYIEVSGTRGLQ